jgi:hypothetical protein
MPDIIEVAEQLKNAPDQWLAQQMQNPSGTAPPWLVASEVARRERLRSGASKAQAPTSSVSQDLIKSLFARIPPTAGLMPPGQGPAGPQPPGMPPVNLSPGNGATLGPAPGGTAPGSFKMPPQGMAGGGRFNEYGEEEDDEDNPDAALYDLPLSREPSRQQQMAKLTLPPPPPETRPTTSMSPPMAAPEMEPSKPPVPRPAPPGPAPVPIPPPTPPPAPAPMVRGQNGQIQQLIAQASQKYKLPPTLLTAMVKQESSNRTGVVSPKGAIGLMQVTPGTAAMMGVDDPQMLFDPAINIDTGAAYMKKLMDNFDGDTRLALAAYNAGPGAVAKYHGVPPYKETINYVNKILPQLEGPSTLLPAVNAMRAKTGIAPVGPSAMPAIQSRLLEPPVPQEPQYARSAAWGSTAEPVAAATAPAVAPPVAPAAIATTPAVAPASVAAPPAPPKLEPLHQAWQPQEPAEIAGLKKQVAAYQEGHRSIADRQKELYGQENLALLEQAGKAFFGKQQDYTKYSAAIDSVMQSAQENLHPSIGSMLMTFGMALMSSPAHNFGQALGQAGSYAMQSYQQRYKEGMRDYLTAAKAGVELQDKIDAYTTKVGQYKMQRLAAQQTGVVADERAYQTQLSALEKQLDTAQNKFNASVTSPAAQEIMGVAIANRERIEIDPTKSIIQQFAAMGRKDLVQEAMMAGKNEPASASKAPPVNDQWLTAAIRKVAQDNGIQLPTDRPVTVQDLPTGLTDKVNKVYSDYAAQRTFAVQEKIADKVLSDLDPEYVGQYFLQHGTIPPGVGTRSAVAAVGAHKMATGWLKEHGYTAQSAEAEKQASKAYQGALAGLTKTHENVEAFSTLAEKNMANLEANMALLKDYGAPILNKPVRDLDKMWKGDTRITNVQANLATVRSEVAKILNSATAAGVINIPTKLEMEELIRDDFTLEQLRGVLNTFRQEIQNRRVTYDTSVKELQQMSVAGQTGATGETKEYQGHTYRKQGDQWVLVN